MMIYSKNIQQIICLFQKKPYLAPVKHRGVEQLVARWAHNPKVIRSSRISATKDKKNRRNAVLLFYDDSSLLVLLAQSENLGDCVKILIFAS